MKKYLFALSAFVLSFFAHHEAQAQRVQIMYLEKVHQFIESKFRIDRLGSTPVVIKGDGCQVLISGEYSYGGSNIGHIIVMIKDRNGALTFHHTDLSGDIQRPSISHAKGTMTVGGAQVTTNHDGTESYVYHRYLRVLSNSVEIENYDGLTKVCNL